MEVMVAGFSVSLPRVHIYVLLTTETNAAFCSDTVLVLTNPLSSSGLSFHAVSIRFWRRRFSWLGERTPVERKNEEKKLFVSLKFLSRRNPNEFIFFFRFEFSSVPPLCPITESLARAL